MALKLTLKDEQFPKDQEFDVGGVLLQNGQSKTLSEEEEQALVSRHGMSVKDYFQGNEAIKVEGSATVKIEAEPEEEEGGE
jgi:hypothetical protein